MGLYKNCTSYEAGTPWSTSKAKYVEHFIQGTDFCSYTLSSVLLVMKEICKPFDHVIAFDCQCGQHGVLEDNCSTGLCCLRGEEQSCVFFKCDHGEVTLIKSQEYWFATVCCCLLLILPSACCV